METVLNHSSRPRLGVLFLFTLAMFSIGCRPPAGSSEQPPSARNDGQESQSGAVESNDSQESRRVEVLEARRGLVRDTITLSTTLEAQRTIDVPAVVPGRVETVHVRPGSVVKAGDPILTIDQTDLRMVAQELELAWSDSAERAKTASIEVEEAAQSEEVRRLSFEKSERVLQRLVRLLGDSGRRPISEEEVETARFARDEARIAHLTAQLATRKARHAKTLADLAVERSQVAWDRARLDLERAEIQAKIGGAITYLELRPGEQVLSGERVATIVDPAELFCTIRVPQRRASQLQIGQKLEISAETHPGVTFAGNVEAIIPVVDPNEGTIEARVSVTDSKQQLKPGAFLSARLVLTERPLALLVPKRSRLFDGNRSYVFVVRQGNANRVEIDTGLMTTDDIEVLPSTVGLEAGDQIVIRGQSRLRDGESVLVNSPKQESTITPGNDRGANGHRRSESAADTEASESSKEQGARVEDGGSTESASRS